MLSFLPENYTCLYIDTNWRHILSVVSHFLTSKSHNDAGWQLQSIVENEGNYVASLSVRSAFAVLLRTLQFPEGSEVIFTALNLQAMADIAESYGLRVKSVDVDISSLEPNYQQLKTLISVQTVMIVVAQLYGRRFPLHDLEIISKQHKLLLVEDCAQGFSGPGCLKPSGADIIFFSFGNIKFCTCFGGALTRIQNVEIRSAFRSAQEAMRIQNQGRYCLTLLKVMLASWMVNTPFITWFLLKMCSLMQSDPPEYPKLLRGFPGDLLSKVHAQPCTALLLAMADRLREDLTLKNRKAREMVEYVQQRVDKDKVVVPGWLVDGPTRWLCPILVENKEEVIKELRKHGIYVSDGTTQLTVLRSTVKTPQTYGCVQPQLKPERSGLRHSDVPLIAQQGCAVKEVSSNSIPISYSRNQVLRSQFENFDVNQANYSCNHCNKVENKSKVEPPCTREIKQMCLPAGTGHGTLYHTNGEINPGGASDIVVPRNAKFMIDHLLYLPVHRNCSQKYSNYVIEVLNGILSSQKAVYHKAHQMGIRLKAKL